MHLNTRGQVSIMSQYSRCNYTDGVERDKRVVGGCEECLADTGVVHVVTGRRQDRRHLVYRTQPPTQLRHKHTEDLVSSVYTTVLLLFLIFNDFCQTKYLKIYRADLRQIFGAARTMAADVQAEISFSFDRSRGVAMKTNFIVVHRYAGGCMVAKRSGRTCRLASNIFLFF